MSTTRNPDLVGIAEAARRYRVNHKTLRRMIDDGEIPAYRISPRIIRVDVKVLDRLFLAGAAAPKAC